MSDILRKWNAAVTEASVGFERRWTTRALARHDEELAARFRDQANMFDEAMITGSESDIERHGAAMVRAYAIITATLDAAKVPDDAYLVGLDDRTGFRVAIGQVPASATRVGQLCGHTAVFVTPDEVAALLASLEDFKAIAAIKRMFPGAEVMSTFGEAAAQSSGVMGNG